MTATDSVGRERVSRLSAQFKEAFKEAPALFFSSPGRAELVGNHTDHNLGKVLVSAISCDILAAVSPRSDGMVEIRADGFGAIRLSVRDLGGREREKGRSVALVRGVLFYLSREGYPVGGFSAFTHSTVFRGAGVSSSAAFEVLIAVIENVLFAGGTIPPLLLARAAQFAENVYFGKPCGLLDQCGVALGGLDLIDFRDPDLPLVEKVPSPAGYSLVLVNTGGSHAGLTAHYAAIRREMGEVAAFFGKRYLREVSFEELLASVPMLRKRTSDRAILRAIHFFEENGRVERAAHALSSGDVPAFLAEVRRSGESSLAYLQNCYVPGSAAQPLALALKLSAQTGAAVFRPMGGGFAGVVLAFCRQGEEREYGREMGKIFGRESVYYTALREEGAGRLEI